MASEIAKKIQEVIKAGDKLVQDLVKDTERVKKAIEELKKEKEHGKE